MQGRPDTRCCLRLYALLLFCFFEGSGLAQSGKSLEDIRSALLQPIADSTRIDLYNELCWPLYSYDQPDSALYYGEKAAALATALGDLKRLIIAQRRMGIACMNKGDYKPAIAYQESSLSNSEQIGFEEGIRKALNNLGVIYLNNELFNKALHYFLRSLKLAEAARDSSTMASLYNNCGVIYLRLNEFEQSKRYGLKAIGNGRSTLTPEAMADLYVNLGAAYRNLGLRDSAETCINAAEALLKSSNSKRARQNYWIGRGLLYSELKQHAKALSCFDSARVYAMNPSDEVLVLSNKAEEYIKLDQSKLAIRYFEEAFRIGENIKAYNNLSYISKELLQLYSKSGQRDKLQRFLKLHLAYRDSNDKYVKAQQIRQQQLEFDYERKQVADSLKFAQREQLKNLELELAEGKLNREKTFRFALIVLLGSVIILAVFLYNRFFITRRQNRIIASQKLIVEEKNREMLDSIHYAQRLQSAILPPLEEIRKELGGEILYLPKDIIGGDFYFFEKHNGLLYFAVCDCTGHGIPGAIMSVVCHQALHKAIYEFNKIRAHELLDKARELVIAQLHAADQNIKDGMDCSLLVMNPNTREYSWSGANNPLWIWDEDGFKELKPDKQPVAWYEMAGAFTEQQGRLKPQSKLCLFSDGYADQFGGEKGKKFKTKQLRELLEQEMAKGNRNLIGVLHTRFYSWKGSLDQIDDVAVSLLEI